MIFDALMLNSPVAIVTLDMEGKVNSCNPAFEKMFGYSHHEVIGNYLDPLISTPDSYFETSNYTNKSLTWAKRSELRVGGEKRIEP